MITPTTMRLGLMMFLQFFIWGAWYVTVGNYMKEHGMFSWVGNAYTIAPIAAIISPFFLGMIADRYFASERVLGVLHILGALFMFAAPQLVSQGPEYFIGALFIHTLFYMPTLGLTNTLAFHNIDNQEKEFPVIRVFGTIGWIVAGLFIGLLLQADTKESQFYVAGSAALLLGLYSFTLPHTPPPAADKEVSIGEIIGLDALALMKQPSFAVFVVSSFLICIPLAAYYSYAPVFAAKVGYENPSSWMIWGQVSEIVFMLAIPFFFRFLGVKMMLLVGMLAWVLRYALFGASDSSNVMWMVFIGILLHGICYDFFFVTGFIYTDKKSGKEIRGQAQGLLVLVTQGLGLGIGAQVMAALIAFYTPAEAAQLQERATDLTARAYQQAADSEGRKTLLAEAGQLSNEATAMLNWQMIWLIPCIAAGVIAFIFLIAFHDRVLGDEAEAEPAMVSRPEPEPVT
jgi:nucleoside transporter